MTDTESLLSYRDELMRGSNGASVMRFNRRVNQFLDSEFSELMRRMRAEHPFTVDTYVVAKAFFEQYSKAVAIDGSEPWKRFESMVAANGHEWKERMKEVYSASMWVIFPRTKSQGSKYRLTVPSSHNLLKALVETAKARHMRSLMNYDRLAPDDRTFVLNLVFADTLFDTTHEPVPISDVRPIGPPTDVKPRPTEVPEDTPDVPPTVSKVPDAPPTAVKAPDVAPSTAAKLYTPKPEEHGDSADTSVPPSVVKLPEAHEVPEARGEVQLPTALKGVLEKRKLKAAPWVSSRPSPPIQSFRSESEEE